MTPEHVEASADTTKRALGYLRWYPSAWRARYGEEFVAHLEDELSARPVSFARTSDIIAHGVLARFRFQLGLRLALRSVAALVLVCAAVLGIIGLTHTWPPVTITSGVSGGISGVGEFSKPSQVNDLAFNFTTQEHATIRITSVKVVPLQGFLSPKIVGAEFSAHASDLSNDHGWPIRIPKGFSANLRRDPLVRAIGTKVTLAHTNVLWLGLRATQLNHAYAIEGVRVTYLFHGASHTMTISQLTTPDVICASSTHSSQIPTWCSQNIVAANSFATFLSGNRSRVQTPDNEALLVVQFAADDLAHPGSLSVDEVQYWAARTFPAQSKDGITSVTRVTDSSGREFRIVIRRKAPHPPVAVCAFRNPDKGLSGVVAWGTEACPT